MPYVNVTSPEALGTALHNGGPVNRRRDGSAEANLSVIDSAPAGIGGGLGLMNIPAERESVRGAVRVVYSFLTPIAWELPDGRWVVSVQNYSPSTIQHQRTAAQAIKYMGDGSPRTLDGRDAVAVLNKPPKDWPVPAAA